MKFLIPKSVPDNYRLLYNEDLEKHNLSLFFLVSVCMFVFEAFLLVFQYIRLGSVLFEIFYFVVYIFALLFSGTFSILYTLYKNKIINKHLSITNFFFVVFFILLALSTSYAELSSSTSFLQNTVFIMTIFSLTSLVCLDYKTILFLLISAVTAFMVIVLTSDLLVVIKFGIALDYLLLFVLNFCVAIAFHNSRVDKFVQKVENEIAHENLQKTNEKLEILNKQLEQTAITDALTGVLNRMAFSNILKTQWTFAAQNKIHLSALMLDVDHFKNYNDKYGHIEGDKCLQKVAQSIVNSLRKTGDFAFRYGGEEFTCILPGTDINGAIIVAERIMLELKNADIYKSEDDSALTISIGIDCCIPSRDQDMFKFIENADKALYISKNNGRNRYTVFENQIN